MNGGVLEAFNWGVVTDPAVINATLAAMSGLHCASGGWRRVLEPSSCSSGSASYERQEFLLIDFAMARIYIRLGQMDKADEVINRTVQRSVADHNLVPEMYIAVRDSNYPGHIGDPCGAIPMVGFGAGAYVITIVERQQATRLGRMTFE